ncbi:hypothetical protein HC031_22340 [Planosporangium thailandense]|uniref:Fibronectin type-III domain-containing protein n=1 Tax=Planosporangium thailandense TaxID=765197 RepID=A0ABX0Y261_9ACTN|nr:fibronectin type III domain-containing protein [Planosporangium thailandense]NJC72435.1 hypothetical protein [Planosporangium thailandense]
MAPRLARLTAGVLMAIAAVTGLTAVTAGVAAAATVPSGYPTDVRVSQDRVAGTATVTWTSAGVTWGTGTTHQYKLGMGSPTPTSPGPNTCQGTITASASGGGSCTFTPHGYGVYYVLITPVTEVGASRYFASAPVPVGGPTGKPIDVTVTQTPGDDDVVVTWTSTGVTWGLAPQSSRQFDVQVQLPDGDYTSGMRDDSCGYHPIPAAAGTALNRCTFPVGSGTETVLVTAKTAYGSSDATASKTVTFVPPHGAPNDLTLTTKPGTGQVTATWTSAGVTSWGSAGEHWYWIQATGPDGKDVELGDCAAQPAAAGNGTNMCTFTVTTAGTYTVSVTPTAGGMGATATKTVDVTLTGTAAPAAPTKVTATPGANTAAVSWTAPTGGGAVTGYTVTATADNYPTRSCRGTVTGTVCTISDLAAGVTYTVHVVAHGPGGDSPEATAALSSPPTGTPRVPTALPAKTVPSGSVTAAAGEHVTFAGSGFKPGSTVALAVYSTPVDLGTATVAADGTFTKTVTLPTGLPAGSHHLLAAGLGPDGTVRYVTKAVTVPAAGLPITGGTTTPIVVTAVALLLLGAALVAATDGRITHRLRRRPVTAA